jgi:hypothetical protein
MEFFLNLILIQISLVFIMNKNNWNGLIDLPFFDLLFDMMFVQVLGACIDVLVITFLAVLMLLLEKMSTKAFIHSVRVLIFCSYIQLLSCLVCKVDFLLDIVSAIVRIL